MALSVIGAGLGRTGTLSLKYALEQLGIGRCYHMMEVLGEPSRADDWIGAATGENRDWGRIFDGFGATVDWPAASYWREIGAHFPSAKVILSVRDADRWFESTQKTIFSDDILGRMPPGSPMHEMVERTVLDMFEGNVTDRAHCISVYERHNSMVKATIPQDNLLVYEVGSGWEPLCDFLDIPVPGGPFPSSNDSQQFKADLASIL